MRRSVLLFAIAFCLSTTSSLLAQQSACCAPTGFVKQSAVPAPAMTCCLPTQFCPPVNSCCYQPAWVCNPIACQPVVCSPITSNPVICNSLPTFPAVSMSAAACPVVASCAPPASPCCGQVNECSSCTDANAIQANERPCNCKSKLSQEELRELQQTYAINPGMPAEQRRQNCYAYCKQAFPDYPCNEECKSHCPRLIETCNCVFVQGPLGEYPVCEVTFR
jgi:hypothetical protein